MSDKDFHETMLGPSTRCSDWNKWLRHTLKYDRFQPKTWTLEQCQEWAIIDAYYREQAKKKTGFYLG